MITQISAYDLAVSSTSYRRIWTEEYVGPERVCYDKYSMELPHGNFYNYWLIAGGQYPRYYSILSTEEYPP